MRRILWAAFGLAGLAIGCGPTGQTEVQPPPDLKTDAGASEKKPGGRAKSANTKDMPSMKTID